MKKLFCLMCACAIFALTSCNKESYRHYVNVEYPTDAVSILFADQTSDSIIFDTFDSYAVSAYNTPWIKVLSTSDYPSSAKIPNSYYSYYQCKVLLEAQQNTSGVARTGYVSVRSYGDDDWDQTAYAAYYQYGFHYILKPTGKYTTDQYGSISTGVFEDSIPANQLLDTLSFQAYDKWTLDVPEGSFITLPTTSGNAGKQTIILGVEENSTNAERSTELTLSSLGGVKTKIAYKQFGVK